MYIGVCECIYLYVSVCVSVHWCASECLCVCVCVCVCSRLTCSWFQLGLMVEDLLKVFTGCHTDTEGGEGYHINISPFTINASRAVGGERDAQWRPQSIAGSTTANSSSLRPSGSRVFSE